MSSFISATLGLIVVFLMAAGAAYSVIRVFRAMRSDPGVLEDGVPGTAGLGGSQRERSGAGQTPRTRTGNPANEPIRGIPTVEKIAPAYIENDEEPVPVIFRGPAA